MNFHEWWQDYQKQDHVKIDNTLESSRQLRIAHDAWTFATENYMPLNGSPLSRYGSLCRAIRLIAKTTLKEQADYLKISPSKLSSIEHGRVLPKPEILLATGEFFKSKVPFDGWCMLMTAVIADVLGD